MVIKKFTSDYLEKKKIKYMIENDKITSLMDPETTYASVVLK